MQLRTTEVLQNFLPVRRVVVATQVGFELSTENFQSGTFANTVCSNKTKDLTWAGHGKSVKLETVGRVAVGDLGLQVGGQVDNVNGTEGTFLGADTATNTQALGNEGDLGGVVDFDTEFTGTDDGAGLFALLTTFLRQLARYSPDEKFNHKRHTLGLHYIDQKDIM